MYVKVSWSRSQFLDPSDADTAAAINGTCQNAKRVTASTNVRRRDDLLLDKCIVLMTTPVMMQIPRLLQLRRLMIIIIIYYYYYYDSSSVLRIWFTN